MALSGQTDRACACPLLDKSGHGAMAAAGPSPLMNFFGEKHSFAARVGWAWTLTFRFGNRLVTARVLPGKINRSAAARNAARHKDVVGQSRKKA
jgi:hypothetical protein